MYCVSNIEYTDLDRLGVSDKANGDGGTESAYPANTNVLYVGLKHIRDALVGSSRAAFPGMLINLTKPVLANGTKGGRLECSMQNIADALMRRRFMRHVLRANLARRPPQHGGRAARAAFAQQLDQIRKVLATPGALDEYAS